MLKKIKFNKIIIPYVAASCLFLVGYIFLDTNRTGRITNNFSIVFLNVILLILIFILKEYKKKDFSTVLTQTFLGPIFFMGSLIISSVIFRLYTSFKENTSCLSYYSFLSDFYQLRFFLPLLLCYQFYVFFKVVFCDNNYTTKHNFYYLIISSIIIMFSAFLWGWVAYLGRFPGLEIVYLVSVKNIKYSFDYIVIALIIIGLMIYVNKYIFVTARSGTGCCTRNVLFECVFSYFFRSKNASYVPEYSNKYPNEQLLFSFLLVKNKFLQLFLSLVILPLLLCFLSSLVGAIHDIYYYSFLKKDKGYTLEYNLFLKQHNLMDNPIYFLVKGSVHEYLRIKAFGWNRRMVPLLKRPNVVLEDQDISSRMNVLLNQDEKIPFLQYPAFRFKSGHLSSKKYNVVIIMLETFETSESDFFKKRGSPYPFLEELKKESLSFNHCFANSEATYQGESAISSSLPIWWIFDGKGSGLMASSYNSSYLKIFKNNGYYSEFSTMWDTFSPLVSKFQKVFLSDSRWRDPLFLSKVDLNIYPFLIAGIQNISPLFDKDLDQSIIDPDLYIEDRKAETDYYNKHGVYLNDDYGYEKLFNKITRAEDPFFIVTHTVSSHTKFPIPRGYKPKSLELSDEDRFYYSAKYADSALKRFFEKIKKHQVYKDTIFVVVSDHTTIDNSLSLYDRYHIPLVIHAPQILEPKIIDEPVFQIDIGPTLLEILGYKGSYTSFGKNLYNNRNKKKRGMILPNWDGYWVFVYDPYIVKLDVDRVYEIYNFRKDKHKNLVNNLSFVKIKEELHKEFLATYQIFGDALHTNRILPRDLIY